MPDIIYPINCNPGIKRDGTRLDGNFYTDAQWTRWNRGVPKKIGGYRQMTNDIDGVTRSLYVYSATGINRIYCGSQYKVQYLDVDLNGSGASASDRTPVGMVTNNNNLWTFATMFDGGGTSVSLLAHVAPNLGAIDSQVNGKLYYGPVNANTPLTSIASAPNVSGGVCVFTPFTLLYGNDGFLGWCDANLPNNWTGGIAGNARIASTKIIKGLPTRGQSGPSGVLWTLDSVVRCDYIGGAAVFRFTPITEQSSVLSSSSIIEYDGLFFWPAVDRFMVYDGTVREVPNQMNLNFFFDNLNYNFRQKIWVTKVPRYGEIWWHYPRGNATECNHVLIYNVRDQTWYDTALSRTAGYFSQVFRYPVMASQYNTPTLTIRALQGLPSTSSGGTASFAFDNNMTTSCTQTTPDGFIAYDFGANTTREIVRVGMRPTVNSTYKLVYEYSQDSVNWNLLFETESTAYLANTDYYIEIKTPITARAFRVRETNGGTLDLVEVYFMTKSTSIYQHEYGVDEITDGSTLAISSYVETSDMSLAGQTPQGSWGGEDRNISLNRVELDMVQSGQMQLEVKGGAYPRADDIISSNYFEPDTQWVGIRRTQRRYMRIRLTSNTQGGNYEMGQMMLHFVDKAGDVKQ